MYNPSIDMSKRMCVDVCAWRSHDMHELRPLYVLCVFQNRSRTRTHSVHTHARARFCFEQF